MDDVENYLKKMGVRGWRKIARVETPRIDPEVGQGPTWTIQPVEKVVVYKLRRPEYYLHGYENLGSCSLTTILVT